MKKSKLYLVIAFLSILAVLAGACAPSAPGESPSTTPSPAPSPTPTPTPTPSTQPAPTPAPAPAVSGTLQVYVTDAPPREEVTSIMVTVSEVQIHKAEAEQEQEQEHSASDNETPEQEREQEQEGDSEWITIDISDNADPFDLLKIQGIEQYLGASELVSGKYTQVRLVVDAVQVALGGGKLQDATLPSGTLKFTHPFNIAPGETTEMIIDFDADRMVTVTGAGKIIVKPVVKLTTRQAKGSGGKSSQKPEPTITGESLVEISCDEFMSTANISRAVEVSVGDEFTVTLCSNPTTGFQWAEQAEIGDSTIIEQTGHDFIAPGTQGNTPPASGTAGQEVWSFTALKEGVTTIYLEYSRPWEGGEKAEWTFSLTVTAR